MKYGTARNKNMHNEHKELILTGIVEGHRPREAPWLVVRSKSEPLWTDPGLKSAISVCELISTKKKKKEKKERRRRRRKNKRNGFVKKTSEMWRPECSAILPV